MGSHHDKILTAEEAAKVLKVDTELVITLLEDKELAGRKLGDEWRTTLWSLISYVNGVPLQGNGCCVPMQCCTPEGDATGVVQCCVPGDSGCC